MALQETVKQVLEAYNAIDQAAARMEQHEQRTAALVDHLERAAAAAWWERLFLAVVAGLVGGLVVAVALWIL